MHLCPCKCGCTCACVFFAVCIRAKVLAFVLAFFLKANPFAGGSFASASCVFASVCICVHDSNFPLALPEVRLESLIQRKPRKPPPQPELNSPVRNSLLRNPTCKDVTVRSIRFMVFLKMDTNWKRFGDSVTPVRLNEILVSRGSKKLSKLNNRSRPSIELGVHKRQTNVLR